MSLPQTRARIRQLISLVHLPNQLSVTNKFLRDDAGSKLALTMRSLILVCIALAVFSATASRSLAQKAGRTPVLVELFTSEGCDTCPPADKYLQRLLQEQPIEGVEIIAMAEHVDYWNRLGWTDPFSSALFSKRQKDYASFFKNDSVYTPQMIVNGTREFRGKDGMAALAEAAKDSSGSIKLNIRVRSKTTSRSVSKLQNYLRSRAAITRL
jgi:hypothetical protein